MYIFAPELEKWGRNSHFLTALGAAMGGVMEFLYI